MNRKEYLGELIGTFILVFFGCGAVASAVLFGALGSLLEVAIVFGMGVSIAIFATRNICPAHLNPAVSIAMWISKKLPTKKLPFYILSQFIGAFLGALLLFFFLNPSIIHFEELQGIVRGSSDSYHSAMIFGEFFPNPDFENKIIVTPFLAAFMEALGTFILVFVIFKLTEKKEQQDNVTPILIGLTVTLLICIIAPFTQGGFNPARDFSPRMIAYFGGWSDAALPSTTFSFASVYIIAPIIGGALAAYLNLLIQKSKTN